jgi:hypothetical protein
VNNNCDNCIHSKVCIYKQRYQEINATLKLKDKLKNDEPFSIELNCKEYESSILNGNTKDFEIGIMPLKQSVSCEGCSIYEDIKKGKTVVNDACSFCSKSPFKITN